MKHSRVVFRDLGGGGVGKFLGFFGGILKGLRLRPYSV